MNDLIPEKNFVQSVASVLVGKKSWGVHLGFGSFLTLEFGKSHISQDGTKRGEFHLWIYGCAWRIEKNGEFIMGSLDDLEYIRTKVGEVLNALVVQDVQVNPSTFDTVFLFESNVSLHTFTHSLEMEHWILFLPNKKTLTVGPGYTYKATKTIL